MKTEKRCTTVMTQDGSFVEISSKSGAHIGQEVSFLMSKAAKMAVASVASLVLLFSIGFGGYSQLIASAHTFVSVDINPSVDLELNALDQVIDVIPNNEDAEAILEGVSLTGMYISDAVEELAELAIEGGYLDPSAENSILLSGTDNDGEDLSEKLSEIAEEVQSKFENRSIIATVVTEVAGEDLKETADEIGVTPGKLVLMEKAILLNPDLDLETISTWSVAQISAAIKEAYTQIKAQNREMTIEEAMNGNPENAEQLQQQLDRLRDKLQTKLQDQDRVSSESSSSESSSSSGSSEKKTNQNKSSNYASSSVSEDSSESSETDDTSQPGNSADNRSSNAATHTSQGNS